MALWLESKSPRLYSELLCPEEIRDYLQHTTQSAHPPHLLISGPPGCGKTAMHRLICRQLLGKSWTSTSHVLQARNIVRREGAMANFESFLRPQGSGSEDTLASRTSLDSFQLIQYDQQTDDPAPAGKESDHGDVRPISRVLVIEDADYLTRAMQAYLRRMMEKTSQNARFIFTASTPSRVIEALRSRTVHVRIPTLTSKQIEERLQEIAEQEDCKPTSGILGDIAHVCSGNLRRAIFLTDILNQRQLLGDRKNVQLLASNVVQREIQLMIELAMRGQVIVWDWQKKDNRNVRVLKGAMGKLDDIMAAHHLSAAEVVGKIHEFLIKGRSHFDINTLDIIMDALARCDVALQHGSKGRIHLEALFFSIADAMTLST